MRAGVARMLNWIVVAAMLFGALAPTLGHAWPGDRSSDSQLTAVCTSTGLKFVKVDAGDDGSSERPAVADATRGQHGHIGVTVEHPRQQRIQRGVTGVAVKVTVGEAGALMQPGSEASRIRMEARAACRTKWNMLVVNGVMIISAPIIAQPIWDKSLIREWQWVL